MHLLAEEWVASPQRRPTGSAAGKKPRKKKGGVAVVESGEAADSVLMQSFVAEKLEETFVEIYAQREDRVLVTRIEVYRWRAAGRDQICATAPAGKSEVSVSLIGATPVSSISGYTRRSG
jgi:hypothetical protein